MWLRLHLTLKLPTASLVGLTVQGGTYEGQVYIEEGLDAGRLEELPFGVR